MHNGAGMKIVKLVLIASFALMTMSQARADYEKQHIFDVTSDFRGGATPVSADIDPSTGEIVGLDVAGDYYSASELRSPTVIQIDGTDNSRKPLQIAAPTVNVNTGGTIDLIYLHDGIRGDFEHLYLSLRKDGDTWHVYANGNGSPVTALHLTKNSILGKVIGIGSINPQF